ncbi:unnamed protein product [Knipowitschia caucasica]
MDYTTLVLSQCRSIKCKVPVTVVLKNHCSQLGQRLQHVEEMVQALQHRPSSSITPQVGGALQSLYTTLMSADSLLQKCSVKQDQVKKSKYKSEFTSLNRLIENSVRILATVPHVSHAPVSQGGGYTVEEVDEDSDEDDDLMLMPYASGRAVTAAQNPFLNAQASLEYESVVLVENGLVICAERITGRF